MEFRRPKRIPCGYGNDSNNDKVTYELEVENAQEYSIDIGTMPESSIEPTPEPTLSPTVEHCQFYSIDVTGQFIPDDTTGNFSTHKDIQLLHSKDAVILTYGSAESKPYEPRTDALQKFDLSEDRIHSILSAACSNYIVYTYEDDPSYQIAFYFDKDDYVICVAYFKGKAGDSV